MARSIPDEADFGPGHEAERVVRETPVAALPDDVVVCHSVQARQGAVEHEIDLRVLWPGIGIACVEVKGGLVTRDGAQRCQSDKAGRHKIKSPIAQAQSDARPHRDSRRPEQKFDAFVVDEAKDFAPEWWDSLLACVNNPDEAVVCAFMDGQQDVYRRWDGQGTVGANANGIRLVPIHVDENLRNTRKIAETFRCLAGEHFTPRTSTGLSGRAHRRSRGALS